MVQLRDDFQPMVGYSQTPRGKGLLTRTPLCPGEAVVVVLVVKRRRGKPLQVCFITEEDFGGKGAGVKLAVAFGFSVAYEPYEIRGSWGISC